MKMRMLAGLAGCLLLVGLSPISLAAEKKAAGMGNSAQKPAYTKEEAAAALANAQVFIAELDKEGGRPWKYFSSSVQKQTTESEWMPPMETLKAICGVAVSRGNMRATYFDKLPDSPPGRYIVYDLDSKFERLEAAERIVMVKEGATWRVAGYFRTRRGS